MTLAYHPYSTTVTYDYRFVCKLIDHYEEMVKNARTELERKFRMEALEMYKQIHLSFKN